VYVEEALLETVEWLVTQRPADEIPQALRSWVIEQHEDPWTFVGDAWQAAIPALVRSRLEGDDQGRYGFNTASVAKVEALYSQILGYCPLREIGWQKKPNQSVRKDISLLVQVRGEIVHRGSTPGTLNLAGVRSWADFVRRLTDRFDERLVDFRRGHPAASKEMSRHG
jgi:hypothetical protein